MEVQTTLAQMDQDVTMQAQDMTAQANRQDVQWENPPVRSMVDQLQDFTMINPLIFIGSKTSEDPRSLWMRYIISLWPWGPQILRRLSLLPISSRMLHSLGARCGRILELWVDFWSLGSCLRQPSWRDSSPGR